LAAIQTKAARRWLVQHRDGWCATKTGMRPAGAAESVPTLCGHVIVLPWGYDQGEPDCPECLAAIQTKAAAR
jgi:hypothetical protein